MTFWSFWTVQGLFEGHRYCGAIRADWDSSWCEWGVRFAIFNTECFFVIVLLFHGATKVTF